MTLAAFSLTSSEELTLYASATESAIADALSLNTRSAYRSQWRLFERWCVNNGFSALPASVECVAMYLSALGLSGKAFATISAASAAIGMAHRSANAVNPCESEPVRLALKGMSRRLGKPQAQAKPLTSDALAAIAATALIPRRRGKGYESKETAERRGLLDIALCRVMSDAGLRRSEAAALVWRCVGFAPDGASGLLTIERSKTDWEGVGAVVGIKASAMSALWRIRPADAHPDDSAFGLGPDQISRRIRAAAIAAGLGDGYTGHSGRVGLAVRMAGAPTTAVMRQGRWKTPSMVNRYQSSVSALDALQYIR